MKDVFGSPGLGDATSVWEELIEEVAVDAKNFLDEDAVKVMNRPPGTVPVKPEDQMFDWQMGMNDPAFWGQHMKAFMDEGDSPDLAFWKVLNYHTAMTGKAK